MHGPSAPTSPRLPRPPRLPRLPRLPNPSKLTGVASGPLNLDLIARSGVSAKQLRSESGENESVVCDCYKLNRLGIHYLARDPRPGAYAQVERLDFILASKLCIG